MSEEPEVKEGQKESSSEDRAKGMGWVPKDEFRGDPNRWSDADTFVKRAEHELPIARATTRRLERELAEMKNAVKEFADHHKATSEREYQRALRDLKAQQKQAVAEADTEKFDQIEKEIAEAHKERATTVPIQQAPPVDPDFQEWVGENRWYNNNKRLHKIADAIGQDLIEDGSPLRGIDFYREVEKEIKRRYPEHFENARKADPPAVGSGSGGDSAPSGKRGKGYSDLPNDARSACDKYVKAGLLTREQYVSDYFEG